MQMSRANTWVNIQISLRLCRLSKNSRHSAMITRETLSVCKERQKEGVGSEK